jgi:hypothetical protein
MMQGLQAWVASPTVAGGKLVSVAAGRHTLLAAFREVRKE